MDVDEQGLGELLIESKDTHADAMRATHRQLAEFVEVGKERRAHGEIDEEEAAHFSANRRSATVERIGGLGAAAGIGAAVLALSAVAASASTPTDVQMLQTNESIENLAVATYKVALTLPFIGGNTANGVVKAFSQETLKQHQQHGSAFAAAIKNLGGVSQSNPDPVLLKVVNVAKPGLTNAAAVVALALELEDGAAQTYVVSTGALKSASARKVTASIMGVEAQHVAILRAVQALLKANDAKYIALPPSPLTGLPSAVGSVGFLYPFYPTSAARPGTEGAR